MDVQGREWPVWGLGIRKTSRKHWPLSETFKNELHFKGKVKMESIVSGLHRVKHTQTWEARILGNPSLDRRSSYTFLSSKRSCSELWTMGRLEWKRTQRPPVEHLYFADEKMAILWYIKLMTEPGWQLG